MEAFELVLEILLFLMPLVIGAKYGPMALIGMSGVSVLIMVEVLRLQPASPPYGAIFIVLAVVIASAAMSAAGGMDYVVRKAGDLMQAHPRQVPIIGPLLVWLSSVLSGTGNITFALLPILYDVSYASKVRPERVLATAAVVSQVALIASPVAAVTATYLSLAEPEGLTLAKMLMVTVPASLGATVITALFMARWGKELDNDPEYQRRLAAGEIAPPAPLGDRSETLAALPPRASLSVLIFLLGVAVVVVLGFFAHLRPSFPGMTAAGITGDTTVSMSFIIPMVMFGVAGLIMVVCGIKTPRLISEPIIGTGLIAALLLLAVPVLAGTVINAHLAWVQEFVTSAIGITVALFALLLFVLSALIQSQVAAVKILIPVAMGAGLGLGPMTGMLGAAGGNNLLASIGGFGQACIIIDKTGTTRQGSFLLNGSFMAPLLVSTVAAVGIGLGMQALVF